MHYELVSGIPRRFGEHVVTCVYTQALEQYGIVGVFDQRGLVNFLYHVPELDELDGPPSYLALLEEECWSDIFAPEYEEDFFPMDRQRIIRLRILGYWHGLRFPEDRSQPEFFHFDRSLLGKYAIVFVYPFCNAGYARMVVMEKRTRKLSYALCKTDGSLIIKKLFQYIAKPGAYAKDSSAALVFADDWTAAIVRTDGSASLLPGQGDRAKRGKRMRPVVEKEIEEILMLHFGSPAERKRWCESVQETFEGFGPQEYIYTEPDAPRESDQSEDATQPKAAMQEHSKPSIT